MLNSTSMAEYSVVCVPFVIFLLTKKSLLSQETYEQDNTSQKSNISGLVSSSGAITERTLPHKTTMTLPRDKKQIGIW